MAKSMIGLDPLAWLSPTAATPNKKSKSKSAAAKKNVVKKKVTKKKIAKKKVAAKNKLVTKKKVIAKKKNIAKKKVAAKSKEVSKKKVLNKNKTSPNSKAPIKKEQSDNTMSPLGLDVQTLESSFDLLAPQAEVLVAKFYEELFLQHPSVIPMFKNTTPEEQQKKLLAALKLVINNVRKPDVLGEVLKGLGEKHQSYGAVPEHYNAVAATLIGVMRDMAGDGWTDQIQSAWEHALNSIAEVMLSSYQDVIVDVTEELSSNNTVDEIQAVELNEQEIKPEIKQVKTEETPVSDSTIKLNEVQDISQVAELHKKVAAILNSQDIVFDGSDVERIDASTLQLITCAFKQADKYGNKVSWHDSSEALKKSASLLGLTEILNL